MKTIYVPTKGLFDWRQFLAQPNKQWRDGYSAKELAKAWECSNPNMPTEVVRCLEASGAQTLSELKLLLAIPEYKVDLPPTGGRPSQTDLFALCRNEVGAVCIAVEGKVDEPFGPTLVERLDGATAGVRERINFLQAKLRLPAPVPDEIRYQLMHRTASAILLAEKFHAKTAVMLVHSFSKNDSWFEDYRNFATLYGKAGDVKIGSTVQIGKFDETELWLGWAK